MHTINTLGNLYAGTGRAAAAEQVLLRGREIDPRNMVTINTLGNLYLNRQRYDDFNRLAVATTPVGKNDATYLAVVAKGALLQHKPELARRAAYASMHNRMTAPAATLYVAAADQDDFLLPKLRAHFAAKYPEIEQKAASMKGDPALVAALDPGLAPRISPVLASGGLFLQPVNRGAVNTFRRDPHSPHGPHGPR